MNVCCVYLCVLNACVSVLVQVCVCTCVCVLASFNLFVCDYLCECALACLLPIITAYTLPSFSFTALSTQGHDLVG